tara:strand:+ start:178 stop:687 length:510 start_codon:yes stop_codon:yes gene_type:complete
MSNLNNNKKYLLYKYTPIFLLFTSIMNEIDFNLQFKYFSFNFAYILIFYYSLKREGSIGYILIFVAGLFNDVMNGLPMGVSSLSYLLLCTVASYLRNITLRPDIIKDWISFVITILILNFFTYTYLIIFFNYEINYFDQTSNIVGTCLFYFIFSYIFRFYDNFTLGKSN